MALTTGNLHIERGTGNAMRVDLAGTPPWKIGEKDKLLFKEDLPGDTHISASINTITRKIQCFDLYFKTQADAELFIANLKTLNLAGTMTLELQTTETPSYFKIDGTNTSIEVLYEDFKGLQQVALGGGSVYKIAQINFIHGG
jgi:hypothetical protein